MIQAKRDRETEKTPRASSKRPSPVLVEPSGELDELPHDCSPEVALAVASFCGPGDRNVSRPPAATTACNRRAGSSLSTASTCWAHSLSAPRRYEKATVASVSHRSWSDKSPIPTRWSISPTWCRDRPRSAGNVPFHLRRPQAPVDDVILRGARRAGVETGSRPLSSVAHGHSPAMATHGPLDEVPVSGLGADQFFFTLKERARRSEHSLAIQSCAWYISSKWHEGRARPTN